jgi:CRISPR-associated protein Csm5
MTTYRFKAYALTPIHIGCGREIDPTEFVLREDRLLHFSTAQLISDLSPADRERFGTFLERAELREIQNFLRHQIDEKRHVFSWIGVSKGFRSEFESKASNPNNQFRVEMMPRNPHTGQAFIPGSGIKGAIRTAVVNYFANLDRQTRDAVHDAVRDAKNQERGRILEEKALNRQNRDTHRDVFRLIHVEDSSLPDGTTRIDRAANFNPGKPGAEKIQMWVERLKSVAILTIALDE